MNDLQVVLEKLNTPSDWALVLGCSTLAFVLDAALDFVPLTAFSPPICAAVTAAATLALKRSFEALRESAERRRRTHLIRNEALRCAELMKVISSEEGYRAILFDVDLYKNDFGALRSILSKLRENLELREPYTVAREVRQRRSSRFFP
jgi:hypothetical protein